MRLVLIGLAVALLAVSVVEAGNNDRKRGERDRHHGDDGISAEDLVYKALLEQCYKRHKNGKRDCPDDKMLGQLGVGQQYRPDRGYFRQEVPVDRCTAEYGPPQRGYYWQFSIETDDWGEPENVCTEIPRGEHQW